ncbi:M23 family metallopeptidase [Hyphobacterium sp. HN65]|uniref:M23 family metallopeptidase n=1 Tax=Hyphobacterium lacteum TaxID=3116575 RepID=A0ABU7LN76_9PROT|nr:M23 family metallopeptidase [Hyphobacterium sp. HN65]MEE2525352.1 M23 family metallopeptidase [Hyphobacterium sp. HN65]
MIGFLMAMALQAGDPIADVLAQDSEFPVAGAVEEAMEPFSCIGEYIEGAAIICRATPGTVMALGDQSATADDEGWLILGINRDADAEMTLSARMPSGEEIRQVHPVEQREYDIQRVDGVPPRTVTPPEEALALIREQSRMKAAAYTSRWEEAGFAGGFIAPAEGIISGVYGSQRFYNGEPRRPHYGLDYANDAGTPVHAPAAGIVTLAHPDMYYEGGLIFIDHGQGFTSAFLHLGAVHVEVGDVVAQGDVIGEIGSGGRATGAHLDWRIKWRNRYIDPALVLQLDPASLR